MNCTVYKSVRNADTYVYVASGTDLAQLPPDLLARLGELREALEFDLHPERRLARADPVTVMRCIEASGFYLQLPPASPACATNASAPLAN